MSIDVGSGTNSILDLYTRLNKSFSSEFSVNWYTPEEDRKAHRSKRRDNKDEGNSPNINNVNHDNISSQKFKQIFCFGVDLFSFKLNSNA